jgi:hypothetical protein
MVERWFMGPSGLAQRNERKRSNVRLTEIIAFAPFLFCFLKSVDVSTQARIDRRVLVMGLEISN